MSIDSVLTKRNLGILIVVLYIALSFFLKDQLKVSPDTTSFYAPVAQSILEGNGYLKEGVFNDRYPPGYPLFISFVYGVSGDFSFSNPIYFLIVILLQTTSCLLLASIGQRVFNKRVGIMAGALLALYPFFAVLSVTQYAWSATALAIFFTYLGVYFYLKALSDSNIYFLCSGLSLSCSSLTWPGTGYLWVFIACHLIIMILRKKIKLKSIILFLLGFFALVVVWQGYSYSHTNKMNYLSGNGFNATQAGLYHSPDSKIRNYDIAQAALARKEEGRLHSMSDVFDLLKSQFIKDPLETGRFLIFKFFRPLYATDSEKYDHYILMFQLPILLFGLYGMILSVRQKNQSSLILIAIIVYYWLIAFVVLSILRYMMPAMGLWILFNAVALDYLMNKFKKGLFA